MLEHLALAVAGAVEEDEQRRVRAGAAGDVGDGVLQEVEDMGLRLRGCLR